jgi:hypothetical protein
MARLVSLLAREPELATIDRCERRRIALGRRDPATACGNDPDPA